MTDILTESVVAPSILKPTVQHTDNSHASSNNCWLGSLLSIANKALAPQLALASPRPTAPPHPLIVSRILLNRQTAQTCGYINADVCMFLYPSCLKEMPLTNRSLTCHVLPRLHMRVKYNQFGPLLLRRCTKLHHTDHLPRLDSRVCKLRSGLPI